MDADMLNENKTLVEHFINNTWGKGRFNLVRQLISKDFLYHASQSMQSQGFDGLVEDIQYLRSAIGDYDLTIEDLMSEGDRAISVMTLCGTFNKPIFGFQPNHKLVGITITVTWSLKRNRIRHMNMMVDIAHMQRQVAAA